MSASQDRLTAKKRRAATQEDEKYTTPKATEKLRLPTLTKTTAAAQKTTAKLQTPTLTKTTAAVPKAAAKLQMPTLTKTASTAQKTTKYKPADTGIKINALGAGDYSGGGRLLEKAAKTVSGAVKGTGSAYANIAGSAVEGMGNLQENMQKGEYDKKLKQMDEYADFYKRSLAAGKNLNTGALLTAQQRAQFERLLKTQYSDAKIAQMRKLYGDATAAQKQRTMETAGAAFATADRLKAAADADVAAAKEGSGKVGQFLVDLGYTGTQMLGDTAANLLVPGAGMVSMATRVYGDASGEARREGKSAGQQALSGLKGATIEVLTEKLFGGLAKAYGKGTADEVVERIADKLTKTAKGKAAATWLINSGGEGVEEVISDALNPLADRALGLDDGEGSVFKAEDLAQMGYDFLLGAAMGAVGGAGQLRAPQISETETTQQKLQMPQLAETTSAQQAAPKLQMPTLERAQYADAAEMPQLSTERLTVPNTARLNNENGLSAYTPQERINLSSGVKNKIVSTYQEVLAFVKNALSNKQSVDRAYMGVVPNSVASRILKETGVDVSGYGVMMNGNDVRHILKSHGDSAAEAIQGQVAVTEDAIAQIPKVIAAPDNVYMSADSDGKGRRVIVFEKQIGDTYITIQGVSDGKRLLQADTMYIRKRKTRKSQDTMLGAEHAAPVINARSELPLSLSSDTTVPQGTADVNTQGSTEHTPLRIPTLDAEGAANEVEMTVIGENLPSAFVRDGNIIRRDTSEAMPADAMIWQDVYNYESRSDAPAQVRQEPVSAAAQNAKVTAQTDGGALKMPQITGEPTNVPVTREQARQRMAEEAAARAAVEEQRRAVPETMQRVGVAPFGSEADYAGAEVLAKNAGDNERARRRMKKEMEKVPATEKERMFARQVYAGQIAMEDIPATVNRATVAKLADYYAAMDRTAETELLRQKRNIILEREAEKMEPLLGPDVKYDEGGLREGGKPSGKIARQFSTLRRNLQTPARICATEWGAEHGEKVYKTLFWPVTENNGRQVEWVNSMIDRVRTFKDSTGEERLLNRAERAIVQRLVETSAAEERVAKFSKQYAPAAENVKNGAGVADAAREFGIQKGTAEYEDLLNYAANLAAKADAKTQENVDAAAVDAAVEAYGELYGELYEAINTFLAAHGYKPIGFIEGYAPHMQPEETKTAFSKAMKLLGLDDTAMMLPTSISGQTADLKPYKQYDPFFQTRQGSKTEYDIAKGFENYIYYLGNIFYHTDDIMRIRAAANYMRKTYSSDEAGEMISWAEGARSFSDEQIEAFLGDYGIIGKGTRLSGEDARAKLNEYIDKLYEQIGDVSRYSEMVKYLDNYANRLAGKQNMADRGAEAATGRGSLNWINALTGKFGGAKLAFNVSSALNQTGQLPIVMAENGEANTARAIRDFFGSKEARDDFAKSSNYLKGKKGVNWLIRDETTWEKIQSAGFAMTQAVDGFTAYVAVRSKYLKELNAGKSKSEAMRAADEYGRNVMGSRARGEKPMLFDTKNPFWQIVTRFQLEAMNSWEHISRDISKEIRNIAKTQGKTKAAQALASRAGRYVVYAFLANLGVGALSGGSPVPFDVVGNLLEAYGAAAGMTKTAAIKTILDNVLQQVFDERLFGTDEPDDDDEADLWAAFESLFGNVANDVPIVGRAAALAGIGDQTLPVTDLSKLGDFAGAVKDKGLFSADALDKGLAAGSEFVFGGNQLKKTVQGARAVAQGGVYGSNGRLRYEVEQSPWNAAQGLLFGKSALKESQEYYAGSDSTSRFSAEGTRLKEAKDAGGKTAEVVSRWWSKQQARITELYKEISDTNAGGADRRRLEEAAAAVRENALDTESTYKAAAEKYLQQGMDVDKAYREANRECFGAEYALEAYNKNVYERAQDARRNGVSYEDFYDYYFSTKDIEATDGMSATEWKLEYLRNSGMDESAQAALWLTDMASDSDVVEQMELEAGAGITLEQYYTYKLAASGSTKKAEKLDAINAADLTVEQKNAIYYAEGWAESKLREAPWYTGRRASKSAAPVLGTTYRPAPVLGERYEYYDAADNRPKPIIGQQYEYYGDGARPAPVIGEKYSPYFTDTVEQSSRPTPVIGEAYTW